MSTLSTSLGAVAIAAIYMVYGVYCDLVRSRYSRELLLRERVAYMLWRAAGHIGEPQRSVAAD